MISIRGIPDASIKSIADNGAATEIWWVDPELVVALRLDGVIQCIEGHSRLHKAGEVVGVNIKDLAHPLPKI